jgi:hypothetical protein
MEKYFLDKRILVNGRKSHIYLDNFIDLSDYILEVIGVYIAANPYPDYTFQNGLTESPLLTAEWGGTLIRNTQISGQLLYNVDFRNLTGFSVKVNTGNISQVASTGSISLEAQNILQLNGSNSIVLKTPLYASKPLGALVQQSAVNGYIEYTPYGLPLVDGTINQTLTTNGSNVVSWTTLTPKCEVLYFTDNPLNTTYSAFGIGDIELATYSMPANTLSSNGSYIEIDLQLQITGLGGFGAESPQFQIDFRGLGSSIIFQHLNAVSYIQTIKARIYRVSNTTHYSTGTSEIFDPITFQTTTNYINNVSGLVTFSNIITFDLNLILNATSDHTVELKHFTITKYIK